MAGEEWQTEQIGGRPVSIFTPTNAREDRIVLFLHDWDQQTLEGKSAFEDRLRNSRLRCLCPIGGLCWWLPVVCPDFDAQQTPLNYLQHNLQSWIADQCPEAETSLLGIGMGGQGVLQLAYRSPRQFPVVAAISPAVEFHRFHGQGTALDAMFETSEDARQQIVTLHIQPLGWPRKQLVVCDPDDPWCFEGTETLISKLYSSGVPVEVDLETQAGGHSWDYFNTQAERAIEWIQ